MHDNSAALLTSDWSQIYRTRLKFMVSKIAFKTGKKFLGENSINGLQMTSMKTALDSDGDTLKQRGYISGVEFDPYTNAADARIGKVTLDISFWAPDEARKLETTIGIVRR